MPSNVDTSPARLKPYKRELLAQLDAGEAMDIEELRRITKRAAEEKNREDSAKRQEEAKAVASRRQQLASAAIEQIQQAIEAAAAEGKYWTCHRLGGYNWVTAFWDEGEEVFAHLGSTRNEPSATFHRVQQHFVALGFKCRIKKFGQSAVDVNVYWN